jgi:hypothetical protein
MAGTTSFTPQTNTIAMSVGTTSHAKVQVPQSSAHGGHSYMLKNPGSETVYVNVGDGTVTAAVIPVDGTPANGFPVLEGETMIISGVQNAYFTAIAAAAGGQLLITGGLVS